MSVFETRPDPITRPATARESAVAVNPLPRGGGGGIRTRGEIWYLDPGEGTVYMREPSKTLVARRYSESARCPGKFNVDIIARQVGK